MFKILNVVVVPGTILIFVSWSDGSASFRVSTVSLYSFAMFKVSFSMLSRL